MDGAEWLRTQLTAFGCAACGEAYDAGRIRVLAEREGLFFVDLACACCGSQAVAIVTIELDDEGGAQAAAPDLAPAGIDTASPDASPVSADDVIDIHVLLDDLQGGDVDALLRRLDGVDEPAGR
jgi:hypothetical protein